MNAYLQTAIGVAVSVALSFFGYRQTIGARKERVRLANAAVRRAVLRRMVLEHYQPEIIELGQLVDGKAQEFQVRRADLSSLYEFLIAIFTEIFDNDLIPAAQRRELEEKLNPVLVALLQQPKSGEVESRHDGLGTRARGILIIIGLIASMVGSIVALLPTLLRGQQLGTPQINASLIGFGLSIATLVLVALVRRVRDYAETPEPPVPGNYRFNEGISRQLSKLGYEPQRFPFKDPYPVDFVVNTEGVRFAIEGRATRPNERWSFVLDYVRRNLEAILSAGLADEAVLVVEKAPPELLRTEKQSHIPLIVPRDLDRYIKERVRARRQQRTLDTSLQANRSNEDGSPT